MDFDSLPEIENLVLSDFEDGERQGVIKVGTMKRNIQAIEVNIDEIETNIDEIETNIANLDARVTTLESETQHIQYVSEIPDESEMEPNRIYFITS